MLRALCLVTTLLVHSPEPALARVGIAADRNAALKYWQAFATLPSFTDAERKKLEEPLTTPVDDVARKILADSEYALRLMHYGAEDQHCDWGMDHRDGIFTRLPQAPGGRMISALVALRARMRFEAGENAAAIDDIIDCMTLGRHCTLAGTNVVLLSGYAIEHQMIETLAAFVPKLDRTMIADIKRRLAALPGGLKLAEACESEEKYFLDWFVRIMRQAKDKEDLVSRLSFVGMQTEGKPQGSGEKEARAFIDECGGSPADVLRRAEETRECYRQVAKMLALPMDQFEKQFDAEARKRADNAVFKVFFPAMVNVRQAHARMEVRRALLSTALTVQQDGPDSLKNIRDPVMGGTFEYAAFDGGFELSSNLKGRDGKSVKLTAGRRGR